MSGFNVLGFLLLKTIKINKRERNN